MELLSLYSQGFHEQITSLALFAEREMAVSLTPLASMESSITSETMWRLSADMRWTISLDSERDVSAFGPAVF